LCSGAEGFFSVPGRIAYMSVVFDPQEPLISRRLTGMDILSKVAIAAKKFQLEK
jgi:hypothetical protein